MKPETTRRVQRILATVSEIPEGAVASYGQVAAIAGLPRGARQVGYALRNLPAASGVPWHRVVTSSGKLAFEPGSRRYKRQVRALGEENVPVLGGRINMQQYGWQPDLDELLWKPSAAWDAP
jgi:methylated-DNA-protein-cysteine methyltransferase related protein